MSKKVFLFSLAFLGTFLFNGKTYSQEVFPVDKPKGITAIRYDHSFIFDYGADDTGFSHYDVSGYTQGISIKHVDINKSYKGWTFQASYGSEIHMEGVSHAVWVTDPIKGVSLDIDMKRLDIEALACFPIDTQGQDFTAGWEIGLKLARIKKEFIENDMHIWDQETLWIGPMAGVSGNLPLGGKDNPFSLFGTFNIMLLYVNQDEDIIVAPENNDDWTELGIGLNGTIGLNYQLWKDLEIIVGYHGQILRGGDSYDGYQGFMTSVCYLF